MRPKVGSGHIELAQRWVAGPTPADIMAAGLGSAGNTKIVCTCRSTLHSTPHFLHLRPPASAHNCHQHTKATADTHPTAITMVATRSQRKPAAGKAAADTNPTSPPKRVTGKRARAAEPDAPATAADPAAKKTKTREDPAPAEPKKPAARATKRTQKATEVTKPATKPDAPKPVARATRATRATKEEPEPKPTKTTTRVTRKAPVKVAKSVTKDVEAPQAATTRAKRATRASKDALTQSPVKDPARKPATTRVGRTAPGRKAKSAVAKQPESPPASTSDADALAELPGYPSTPSHIKAPLSNSEALKQLPESYPATPAHIRAPLSTMEALKQLPESYPDTPAHIRAPLSNTEALKQLPESYPDTPAHIRAPISSMEALKQLPESYPDTPAISNTEAPTQLPESSPATPTISYTEALEQLPESSPSTPTFTEALEQLPESSPDTLAHIEAPVSNIQALNELFLPTMAVPASVIKSALRSPLKNFAKTPKKTVTWDAQFQSDDIQASGYNEGVLSDLCIFVDIPSGANRVGTSLFYTTGFEEMGARVFSKWPENVSLTHVVFQEGTQTTINKVIASNGTIKCVTTEWAKEVFSANKRVDEANFLVDFSTVAVSSTPVPRTPSRLGFTPAKTPTAYLQMFESSSAAKSREATPSTPSSGAFDRTPSFMEDKENDFENSTLLKKCSFTAPRPTASRPVMTPSKESLLSRPPIKRPLFDLTPAEPSQTTSAKRPFFDKPIGKSPFLSQSPTKSLFSSETLSKGLFLGQPPKKTALPNQGPSEDPFSGQSSMTNPFVSQAPAQSGQPVIKKPFLHSAGPIRATQTPGRFSKLWANSPHASEAFKRAYKEATQTNVETPAKKRRFY